jgi:hypothetical protein
MVPARVIVTCALVVVAAGACTVGSTPTTPLAGPPVGDSTSATSTTSILPPCTAGGPEVDLGAFAYDRTPESYVRTRAGWYRLTATGFLHGGLFDAKEGRTTIVWGLSSSPPAYHPGPNKVTGLLDTAEVTEGEDVWVELPDATLWFLNAYGARLTIQGCPPAVPAPVTRS